MCKDNQRQKLRDGSLNSWFVRSNIFDLHIIRHEFGHVFQYLFQDFLAEKNPKFADSSVYAREFKNFLLDFARFEEWDESVMTMSEYGQKNDFEWFAESFANSLNVLDDRPFEEDPKISPEEREKQKKLMNEARLVGRFVLCKASDFGYYASSKSPPS